MALDNATLRGQTGDTQILADAPSGPESNLTGSIVGTRGLKLGISQASANHGRNLHPGWHFVVVGPPTPKQAGFPRIGFIIDPLFVRTACWGDGSRACGLALEPEILEARCRLLHQFGVASNDPEGAHRESLEYGLPLEELGRICLEALCLPQRGQGVEVGAEISRFTVVRSWRWSASLILGVSMIQPNPSMRSSSASRSSDAAS